MSSSSSPSSYYPKEVIDPHHHFLDTANNSFQTFLNTIATNVTYLPRDYTRDVIQPLAKVGVTMIGTVHVEAMPDNGVDEVAWVEQQMMTTVTDDMTSSSNYVKGYVASANLTHEDIEQQLQLLLKTTTPNKLRGIRWIVDCVGKYMEGGQSTATHVGTKRHDGIDYLKLPEFERGLALLEKFNLSFDLQCAPIQLVESAAALFGKYQSLKVCIHLRDSSYVSHSPFAQDGH
jgi:predicted TIM-barrel fold metal-dependent hydrolase